MIVGPWPHRVAARPTSSHLDLESYALWICPKQARIPKLVYLLTNRDLKLSLTV